MKKNNDHLPAMTYAQLKDAEEAPRLRLTKAQITWLQNNGLQAEATEYWRSEADTFYLLPVNPESGKRGRRSRVELKPVRTQAPLTGAC